MDRFSVAQLGSLWSPSYEDHSQKTKDIQQMINLNKYKGGNTIIYKTISYLKDRSRYENQSLEKMQKILIFGKLNSWNIICIFAARISCCGNSKKVLNFTEPCCRFEPRWLTSLSQLELPVQLMWATRDSVSPITIPEKETNKISIFYAEIAEEDHI